MPRQQHGVGASVLPQGLTHDKVRSPQAPHSWHRDNQRGADVEKQRHHPTSTNYSTTTEFALDTKTKTAVACVGGRAKRSLKSSSPGHMVPQGVAVVATVLLACSTAAAEAPSQLFQHSKTVFSDSFRAVFVAGLEGTGHHLFRTIVDSCSGFDENTKPPDEQDNFYLQCVEDKYAMCTLYNNTKGTTNPHSSLFNPRWTTAQFVAQRQK